MLRAAPSPFVIEALLGSDGTIIVPSFNTILENEAPRRCIVFSGTREDQPINLYGNLLWLQAKIRAYGFAQTDPHHPHSLHGPIVIATGDDAFLDFLT